MSDPQPGNAPAEQQQPAPAPIAVATATAVPAGSPVHQATAVAPAPAVAVASPASPVATATASPAAPAAQYPVATANPATAVAVAQHPVATATPTATATATLAPATATATATATPYVASAVATPAPSANTSATSYVAAPSVNAEAQRNDGAGQVHVEPAVVQGTSPQHAHAHSHAHPHAHATPNQPQEQEVPGSTVPKMDLKSRLQSLLRPKATTTAALLQDDHTAVPVADAAANAQSPNSTATPAYAPPVAGGGPQAVPMVPLQTEGEAGAAAPVATELNVVGDGNELNEFTNKDSLHKRSLIISIVLWLTFIFFIAAAGSGNGFWEYSYGCANYDSPFMCGVGYLFPICAILYLFESLFLVCDSCVKCKIGSSTLRYVANIKSDSSSEQFIAGLHAQNPQFCMHVVCYHYETRSRTVYYNDGTSRTEYYQVRVNTHSATDYIRYDNWMDHSTSVCGLGLHRLVKMELSKSYQYADEHTAAEFDRQRQTFQAENDLDEYQDYSESYIIGGYEQYALCARHGEKPKFLHVGYYVMMTVLMMTWVYRRWLEKLCLHTKIRIRKRVSCSPAPPQYALIVGVFGQQRDMTLTQAIVYQAMYNEPYPGASPEIQQQASQAVGIVLPDVAVAEQVVS